MNASEIIRALGGASAVAQWLGAGRSAVSNWPREGIPAKYWPALARRAATIEEAKGITIDVLESHTKLAPPDPAAQAVVEAA